jgi:hypothetical protein
MRIPSPDLSCHTSTPAPRAGTKLASSLFPTVVGCTRANAYLSRVLDNHPHRRPESYLSNDPAPFPLIIAILEIHSGFDEMVSTLLWVCGYVIVLPSVIRLPLDNSGAPGWYFAIRRLARF